LAHAALLRISRLGVVQRDIDEMNKFHSKFEFPEIAVSCKLNLTENRGQAGFRTVTGHSIRRWGEL
jgi:hypothetical protein